MKLLVVFITLCSAILAGPMRIPKVSDCVGDCHTKKALKGHGAMDNNLGVLGNLIKVSSRASNPMDPRTQKSICSKFTNSKYKSFRRKIKKWITKNSGSVKGLRRDSSIEDVYGLIRCNIGEREKVSLMRAGIVEYHRSKDSIDRMVNYFDNPNGNDKNLMWKTIVCKDNEGATFLDFIQDRADSTSDERKRKYLTGLKARLIKMSKSFSSENTCQSQSTNA